MYEEYKEPLPLPRCSRGWWTRGGWGGSLGRGSTRTNECGAAAKYRNPEASSPEGSAAGGAALSGSLQPRTPLIQAAPAD